MWFCGFSLDNLSLMALTIGTGFVVDDAIVMIENIVRHMEEGEAPLEAALTGAREIGFTVISLTVSLIAVFIPLLFMTGLVGRMFREFALTLTIAVVVSAIVSLTLTPMMCAQLLRHDAHERRQRRLARWFNDARRRQRSTAIGRSLEWVLRHQALTLLITAAHARAPRSGSTSSMPEGLPAAAGHRPDHRRDRGRHRRLVRRDAAAAGAGRRRDPRRIRTSTGVVSVVGVSPLNADAERRPARRSR